MTVESCPICKRDVDPTEPIILLQCGSEDRCESCARIHVLTECQSCMDKAVIALSYQLIRTCEKCAKPIKNEAASHYFTTCPSSDWGGLCSSCAMIHVRECETCLEKLPVGSRFYANRTRHKLFGALRSLLT